MLGGRMPGFGGSRRRNCNPGGRITTQERYLLLLSPCMWGWAWAWAWGGGAGAGYVIACRWLVREL